MIKSSLKVFVAVMMVVGGVLCSLHAITFVPNPSDLDGLDHHNSYTWTIASDDIDIANIRDAVLTFTNIWDWTVEKDDHLYVHLLPGNLLPQPEQNNVIVNDEGWPREGDYFEGQGDLVGIWSDPVGGAARDFDLVFRFSEIPGLLDAFKEYAADGYFGFGIDPDCHYYNDGVKFNVVVPEPSSMLLLSMGLVGLAGIGRKKLFRR